MDDFALSLAQDFNLAVMFGLISCKHERDRSLCSER